MNYPYNGDLIYRILGGLGNQIFQIHNAIEISKLLDNRVLLDFSGLQVRDQHGEFWTHSLRQFEEISVVHDSSIDYSELKPLNIADFQTKNLTKLGENKIYFHGWTPSKRKIESIGILKPRHFLFDEQPLSFHPIEIGAIHLRRGDYYQNENLGITSESYLMKSIKFARKRGVSFFHIYSDDEGEASFWKDNCKLSQLTFEVISEVDAIHALRKLSQYRTLIASNSTYSFWASFFSQALTYFPYPFYTHNAKFGNHLFDDPLCNIKVYDFPRVLESLRYFAVSRALRFRKTA